MGRAAASAKPPGGTARAPFDSSDGNRFAAFVSSAGHRLTTWTLLIATGLLPLVFMSVAKEAFRGPKEIVFHSAGFTLLASIAMWSVRDGPRAVFEGLPRRIPLLISAIVLWTAVATVTSTNVLVSVFALVHAVVAVVWFLAAWAIGRRAGMPVLVPFMAAGVLNASFGILQGRGLWSPIDLDAAGRMAVTGLMGNPNDLGGLIAIAAVPTSLFTVSPRRWIRFASMAALPLMVWGIIETESGSAAASLVAGFAAMVLATASRRRKWPIVGAVIVALAVAMAFSLNPRIRTEKIVPLLEGRPAELLEMRALGYATAIRMIRNDPLTGVGPGCFGWRYPDTQKVVLIENPDLAPRGVQQVFIEVHSDHLEIAAETGIPGALIEAAAFIFLLAPFRRRRAADPSPYHILGWVGTWGLCAAFFVQMTLNFPLQISGILAPSLFLAGVFTAWQSR